MSEQAKFSVPTDPVREAFEEWADDYGHNLTRCGPNPRYYAQDECNDSWAAWQAALSTQPQAPQGAVTGWQPIETAPKDGTAIMLGARGGSWIGKWLPVYQSGFVPDNKWSSLMLNHDHMGEKWQTPTHWQPLPAAPETPEGKK